MQALPRRLHFAVVDEVDSVLIDESRNPMIISTSVAQNEEVVRLVDMVGEGGGKGRGGSGVRRPAYHTSVMPPLPLFQAVGSLWRGLQDRVQQVVAGYRTPPDEKTRMVGNGGRQGHDGGAGGQERVP